MKKIFTSAACFLLILTTIKSQWALTGNAITAGQYLGTTNAQNLLFKANGTNAGLIDVSFQNTFLGLSAGGSTNATAIKNSAMGYEALTSDSSGYGNSVLGYFAMFKNKGGSLNVAIGSEAMYENTSGNYNNAVGLEALYYNTSGVYNNAFGYSSILANTTGGSNSAYGTYSLDSNTTGSNNTAIGYGALAKNTVGSNNSAIGYGANVDSIGRTNTTVIGYNAIGTANNQVRVGNTSVTLIGGSVGWSVGSDGRFKKNIKENVPGIEFIKLLRPVTYNYNIRGMNQFLSPENSKSNSQDEAAIQQKEKIVYTGFIAQEVETAAKKLNYDFSGINVPRGKNDIYSLSYADFVVPLVKAMQQIVNSNDSLQTVINNLQSQINDIQQQINMLKTGNLSSTSASGAILKQNAPNPFNSNTIIGYYIPDKAVNAQVTVTDISGQVLKTISINGKGAGQTTIYSGQLAAGTYLYSLIVDGNRVDTKKMILY